MLWYARLSLCYLPQHPVPRKRYCVDNGRSLLLVIALSSNKLVYCAGPGNSGSVRGVERVILN